MPCGMARAHEAIAVGEMSIAITERWPANASTSVLELALTITAPSVGVDMRRTIDAQGFGVCWTSSPPSETSRSRRSPSVRLRPRQTR